MYASKSKNWFNGIQSRKRLFADRVSANKKLFADTISANKKLFAVGKVGKLNYAHWIHDCNVLY